MNSSESELFGVLGLYEEPYGIYYTDNEPESGVSPKPGQPISRELERQGKINFQKCFEDFSCVMGKLWLARKKKTAAYFDATRYGCFGGAFYLGFCKPALDLVPHYISTGIPNTAVHGELFVSSYESANNWIKTIDPEPAPAKYCVFKPISQFPSDERPALVVFFARGEVMSGLCNLAAFVTDNFEVVATPFGSICSYMVSWPLHYLAKGQLRAVLGCGDPSGRKFMKPDEMTFTVPYALYEMFIARWEASFLKTNCWDTVRIKIKKSDATWQK